MGPSVCAHVGADATSRVDSFALALALEFAFAFVRPSLRRRVRRVSLRSGRTRNHARVMELTVTDESVGAIRHG